MSGREEWERLEPLLDQALELEGEELERFLAEVERDDPRLRRRLDEYLGATEHGSVLDLPLRRVAGDLVDRLELDRLDTMLAPGRRVGAYEILEEVGEGGMGRVYLARRVGIDPEELVALKVLNKSHSERQEMQQRFERERQILANLEHPGIARVLDAGVTADSRPFFALEYVKGDHLLEYCRSRELGLEARVRLFLRVCDAVHHAHQRGVVHRDLKPSNLLVADAGDGGDPRVCVLDFGIAREEKRHEITLTGQIMGTPGYMSPEQARGRTALVDHRADVFSLGVILYELIGGRKPFDGKTPADVLLSLVDDDPLPLAGREAAVPASLERIVLQCLAKEPAERYDSVELLSADLDRFLAGTAPLLRRGAGDPRWRDVVRRFGPALVVGGLAVVVLLGLGVAACRKASRERRESRLAAELYARGETIAAELRALDLAPRAERERGLAQYTVIAAELSESADRATGAIGTAAHQAAGLAWQALGEPEPARRHLEASIGRSTLPAVSALALGSVLGDWRALEAVLRRVEEEVEAVLLPSGSRPTTPFSVPDELLAALETAGANDRLNETSRAVAALRALLLRGEFSEAAKQARDVRVAGSDEVELAVAAGDALLASALWGAAERPDVALGEAAAAFRRASERAPGDSRWLERLCVVEILARAEPASAAGRTGTDPAGSATAEPCAGAVALAPERWQPHALVALERALEAGRLAAGDGGPPAFGLGSMLGSVIPDALDAADEAIAAAPESALARRTHAAVELASAERSERDGLTRVESAVSSLQTAIASLRSAAESERTPGERELEALLQWRLGIARLEGARLGGGEPARSAAELAVEALRRADLLADSPAIPLAIAEACRVRAEQELGRGPAARDWVEQGLQSLEQARADSTDSADSMATLLARAQLLLVGGRLDELSGVEPVDAAAAAEQLRTLVEGDSTPPPTVAALFARAELILARDRLARGASAAPAIMAARNVLRGASGPVDADGTARAELLAVELLDLSGPADSPGEALDAGRAHPSPSGLRDLARTAAALADLPEAGNEARLAPARVGLALARAGDSPSRLDAAEASLRTLLAEQAHDVEALWLLAAVHLERARSQSSTSRAAVELWRGIDAAERAREERPAWAEAELLLARLYGALATHKTGAERREALRQEAASARRARELNPLLGAGPAVEGGATVRR